MRYINYVGMSAAFLFLASSCLDQVGISSFDLLSAAHAKGGNGGGNGNGGGGNGNGGGGNGKGGGQGGSSGGKSGSGQGSASGGKGGSGQGGRSMAGGQAKGSQGKSHAGNAVARSDKTRAAGNKSDIRSARQLRTEDVAHLEKNTHRKSVALPDGVSAPKWKDEDGAKNFHAKLGRLNSLNRNYHAYLNTKSPHFASLAAFVRASAELDLAQGDLTEARNRLAEAEGRLGTLVSTSGIVAYDDAVGVYDDPTLADLQNRLNFLNDATVAPEDEAAFNEERDALQSILGSEAAAEVGTAKAALDDADGAVAQVSLGTGDDALRQALLDAANENRVTQYGDDYIDDDVMNWAKQVLGVGDSFGKIDEVRQALEPGSGSE